MAYDVVGVRSASYYVLSILLVFAVFTIAMGYVVQTIAINSGRISDLSGIEANIQSSAAQLSKNPAPEDVPYIKAAISDLNAQKAGKQKEIDYGNRDFWGLGFRECALPLRPDCFHRNSSAGNILYLAIAGGLLGVCLLFLIGIRKDALSEAQSTSSLNTLISFVCLVPSGAIVGMLTLFMLRGAKGALLTPVSDVVQLESPFGVAFACTFAAFFSDRILVGLSRLADHFGLGDSSKI